MSGTLITSERPGEVDPVVRWFKYPNPGGEALSRFDYDRLRTAPIGGGVSVFRVRWPRTGVVRVWYIALCGLPPEVEQTVRFLKKGEACGEPEWGVDETIKGRWMRHLDLSLGRSG